MTNSTDFILLKRTYPISKIKRECDGYKYVLENYSEEQRKNYCINLTDLKRTILVGEKYIYLVGKENGKFKTQCISIHNFQIIRKKIFKNKNNTVSETK